MIKSAPYIFLLSLLLLFGCRKNEFSLNFDISEDITDNFNVTYYATDIKGGVMVQAVASVREGKCLLNGFTKKPTLVFITARKSKMPTVVYAVKGDKIEITGQGNDPLAWKVEGNEINRALSEWRENNLKTLEDNNADSVNMAVKDFVELNNTDPVSTILMLCYYDRKINEKEYSSLMASLKEEAKNKEWLTIIGRSDQMYHSYYFPAAIENVVLRSTEESGKDTLSINHKNPVFFFFWQTGDNNRKSMLDSIKALCKEIPDSSLLIADICLDVDSMGWRNAIRRDSLEKVKRFWVPTGRTDPEIHKFKVDALPYYIVFDKNGHQYYRGTDISDAMKDYRNLFNSKDTVSSDHAH